MLQARELKKSMASRRNQQSDFEMCEVCILKFFYCCIVILFSHYLVSQQRILCSRYGINRSHWSKNQIKICWLRNPDFARTCPSRMSEWKDFRGKTEESVRRHFPYGRRQSSEDLKLFRINFSGKCNQICPINIQGDGSRWQGVQDSQTKTSLHFIAAVSL